MIKAIVTDIEGTTSSLSFVKDILFPYARKNIGDFLRQHQKDLKVKEQLDAVYEICKSDDLEQQITQLTQWIDEDKKITPLKTLQGMIWEHAYLAGDFHGHIYPDAVEVLEQWYKQGIKLYVYSSGSVHAQKLLFAHTSYGDITHLFSGYFDTRVGAKSDKASYDKILHSIDRTGDEVLFLSDIKQELDAAKTAGMATFCLDRENTQQIGGHPVATSFTEIRLT